MKLSIIIPVYNEEKTIAEVITKIKDIKLPKDLTKEIIVVDDGSKDNSQSILRRIKGIKLFSHETNKGKGAAVRTGLNNAKGDIIVIQDADLEYNPQQIPQVISPILSKEAEVVYGLRFLKKGNENWKLPAHYVGNRILSFLTNLLYGCNLSDMETGYKAFTKKAKESINLESNDFGFEVEFTAKICKKGFKIKEVPIKYRPRLWNEGKKITWKDGAKAFYYLIKFRFIK